VFPVSEEEEEEVVDPDADQDRGDQGGRARLEREVEQLRAEHDQATCGGGDERDRDQRDDGSKHASEEQKRQEDDSSVEQQTLPALGRLGGVDLVRVRGDTPVKPMLRFRAWKRWTASSRYCLNASCVAGSTALPLKESETNSNVPPARPARARRRRLVPACARPSGS
jgi:hypothetical protein